MHARHGQHRGRSADKDLYRRGLSHAYAVHREFCISLSRMDPARRPCLADRPASTPRESDDRKARSHAPAEAGAHGARAFGLAMTLARAEARIVSAGACPDQVETRPFLSRSRPEACRRVVLLCRAVRRERATLFDCLHAAVAQDMLRQVRRGWICLNRTPTGSVRFR